MTLTLEAGELRCLVGPNGAGKTTLMDSSPARRAPTRRRPLREPATDITKLSEERIAELGIGRKFQRPTVFQGHTVFENLELTTQGRRASSRPSSRASAPPQRDAIDKTSS